MPAVAVTGATGHLGGTVAQLLAAAGIATRLLVRDASRAPRLACAEVFVADYEHQRANVTALSGVDTVFMVPLVDGADHLMQHHDFVDAVVAAGVRHLVYLSFVGADPDAPSIYHREHGATERYLADTGLDVTILRANYFAETLHHFRHEDRFSGPVGDGRVAAVAADDVAASVAAVLSDPQAHVGQLYELSGPDALTFDELAEVVERAFGEPCRFVDQTDEEARASRVSYGAPDETLETWLSMYVAIRHGKHAHVTDDVRHLTGREPTTVEHVFTQMAHNIEP